MSQKLFIVDFESHAIDDSQPDAPLPVGVSIMDASTRQEKYRSWGHPSENNCTFSQGREALRKIWEDPNTRILFHNSKFDCAVATQHMELEMLPWNRIHDTLFLAFLHDPHSRTLSLKPLAEKLLGMAPDERNAVEEWLAEHGFIKKVGQKGAGAFISKAPGKLVGAYARGDVVRTLALFEYIYPKLDEGMVEAYERELRLMPILMRNELEGMRVNIERLGEDVEKFTKYLGVADDWLRKRLGNDQLNLDADAEVAAALDANELVSEWVLTKTGKKSVAKKNLTIDKILDPEVSSALGYRNRLTTVLSMSMRPWLEQSQARGFIYTKWNQVRQADEKHGADSFKGTRSGRLSCSRFQNISKDFMDKGDGYAHPAHIEVEPLPLVRKYILPDEGEVFCHRDYNQQEFRIFAHFEDGSMCAAYRDNPYMDFHDGVKEKIKAITGQDLARRPTKILNFGMLYGMGAAKLAMQLGTDIATAKLLRNAQRSALPDLRAMETDIKQRAREGLPLRTWGGRLYYCEPPIIHNGKKITFEYKLLNYLIQGSAADCTKEAVIRYDQARKDGRFMVTVHDEINFSAKKPRVKSEMKILKDVMASVEMSVPMISDGKTGPSWGELTKYAEAA